MTTVPAPPPAPGPAPAAAPSAGGAAALDRLERQWRPAPGIAGWLTTTDHKRIGLLYFWATLVLFAAGGIEALVIRTQLARPEAGLVGPGVYDQLFTVHGLTMIFWFIIPMTTGAFGNYLLPLMIGARDMAFPRLNAASFWIFAASGVFLYASLALGMAPDAGWFDYVPLADRTFSPGRNIDFYCLAIIFNSIASTLTAAQFIVTIFKSRAPGMSLNRLPLFCFAMLAASFGLLFALPVLSADTIFLFLDRNVGTHFFDPSHGGSTLLWQHLFWFFGHPEVYILIVPAFGIATEIIPAFTQRRMQSFPLVAIAELLVVFIGFGVWAHHMFATGETTVSLVFFAAATAIVVIPSTIQVFAWCWTMLTGLARFQTPLLFIAGFIFMFVAGGLTGIMFLAIPFDQQVTDTYFVVAHFHYIIFGAAVFPIFGGLYYWFPKVTGRLPFDRPGQVGFWIIFVGTNLLFFPMHVVGLLGMTRRVYTYADGLGWAAYNLAETVGAFLTLAGILLLLGNLVRSYRNGAPAGPDPWHGPTLEWTIPSPPPEYDFAVIPKVSSAYPNWDEADRAEDREKLARGVLVLDRGHQQVEIRPVDGELSEVVRLPHSSPWPILLAAALSLVFAMLVLKRFEVAGLAGIALAGTLAGWHAKEPEGDVGEAASRRSRPAAWWGMVALLASEATIFGAFIGTYFYLRFHTAEWPPAGDPRPAVLWPAVLVGVLAASSGAMQLGWLAGRAGHLARARLLVGAALVVQAGWLAWEIDDFRAQQHALPISRDAYASIHHVLLGADHAHVAIGLLLGGWLLARLARGLTAYRLHALQAIAWYWHGVTALTLVVFLVTVSPRL